jgi:hypothetical protein
MMSIPVGRMVRTGLKIQEVATVVHANCSRTVNEVAAAAAAEIIHGICHIILSDDLNMSRVTQYSVPFILMQGQHDGCMSTCGDVIDSAVKDGMLLNQIMTGNEAWCFLYSPQLKRHLTAWKLPSSPRQNC